jgi:hypothetical protein
MGGIAQAASPEKLSDVNIGNNSIYSSSLGSIIAMSQSTTPDAIEAFVRYLYGEVLIRPNPTVADVNWWSNGLRTGRETPASVVNSFFTSDDMTNRGLSTDLFIRELYRITLGRPNPAQACVDYWTGRVNAGLTRPNLVRNFTGSADFTAFCNNWGLPGAVVIQPPTTPTDDSIVVFVRRLYSVALNRPNPAEACVNWWSNLLRTGRETGASVAGAFFFSDDMFNRDLGNRAYVEALYGALLNRSNPREVDVQYWQGRLATGMSRSALFTQFITSDDFNQVCRDHGITRGTFTPPSGPQRPDMIPIFVRRLYRVALDRPNPATNDVNWWSSLLRNGSATGASVAGAFLTSSDFQNLRLDNGQYVDILYRALLDRPPTSAEITQWRSRLDAGALRDTVLVDFLNTAAFEQVCRDHGFASGTFTPPQRDMIEVFVRHLYNVGLDDIGYKEM